MATSSWRSARTIGRLNRLDRAGFALEFLRRNEAYRSDYARTLRQIAAGAPDPDGARADLARRWGLRFRPRP
jgi:hypothetical protein